MVIGLQQESNWKPGQKVRIISGPFKDFSARISKIDRERGRVRVMIDIIGRDTPVEVDFSQIEPEASS